MAILPERARLVVQRQLGDPLGELGKVEFARIEICRRVSLAHQTVAIEAIGDAGGMTHQVENGDGPGQRHQFERLGAVLGLFLHTDLHIREGGNVLRDGIVELDLAVLDQLHRHDGRDRLGQRRQAEDGLVRYRRLGHHVLHAEGLVIDILAALPDQDVRAGDLAGRHLVLEELGYLRKLVLIETRSGGNIERAFGADRRRGRQHQRTAGERTQQLRRIHWNPSGIRRECNERVIRHKGCRSRLVPVRAAARYARKAAEYDAIDIRRRGQRIDGRGDGNPGRTVGGKSDRRRWKWQERRLN